MLISSAVDSCSESIVLRLNNYKMKAIFNHRRFRLYLAKLALTVSAIAFSEAAFAQLTEVSASLATDSIWIQFNDSVGGYQSNLNISIVPNDPADLGSISVVVYDAANRETVFTEIVKTRDELESSGWSLQSPILFNLGAIQSGTNYEIVCYPQTLTGANALERILYYSTDQE